jgi:hypothetical protein
MRGANAQAPAARRDPGLTAASAAAPAHERIKVRFPVVDANAPLADAAEQTRAQRALHILSTDQDTRHAVSTFLLGSRNPELWTAEGVRALVAWIAPAKIKDPEGGDAWVPSARAVEETKVILATAEADKAQA